MGSMKAAGMRMFTSFVSQQPYEHCCLITQGQLGNASQTIGKHVHDNICAAMQQR